MKKLFLLVALLVTSQLSANYGIRISKIIYSGQTHQNMLS